MKITDLLKKVLPHLVAILVMLIVSSLYFYPAIEGKSLQGHDVSMNYGKWREINDYKDFDGKRPLWNSILFSGMPEFLSTNYQGSDQLAKLFYLPQRLGLPVEVASLFWYMLGFYIMMIAFGTGPWAALGVAIGFGLTTYNIIIIGAGHYKKVFTLALIPPTLGGIAMILKERYIAGFILTTLFLALQIMTAHVQMTYYFGIGLILILLFEAIFAFRDHTWPKLLKAGGLMLLAALLATAPNYAKLINLYDYNEHTIRGGGSVTAQEEGVTTKGLDKDYINAWSSGVDEALMIIIPNVKGGKSGAVSQNQELMRKAPAEYRSTIGGLNEYWGDQPFSGGPNYIGTVITFLFILGLFVVKNRIRYGLLAAVTLLTMLSMGGHFPALSNLFIDNVPLYNKFRAPVSILAVVAIFLPLLAALTLHELSVRKDLLEAKRKLPGLDKPYPVLYLAAFGYIAFLLLLLALPSAFNSFFSNAEMEQIGPMLSNPESSGQMAQIVDAIERFRISVFRGDILRALLFTLLSLAFIWLMVKRKIKAPVFLAAIALLILVDLWPIGRRYVPLKDFTRKTATKEAHQLTPTDRQIYQLEMSTHPAIGERLKEMETKFPAAGAEENDRLLTYAVNTRSHYRVFNVTQSPFNENSTSNAHRSIGGYHAAKLRRYQDLIEQHIGKSSMPVINMLNTKYFITKEGLQVNPGALGSAWFVDSLRFVEGSSQEIDALNSINPGNTAVASRDMEDRIGQFSASEPGDTVVYQGSAADELTYRSRSAGDRLLVFSEVYYPDWKLYVDEKEVPVFRVNYILRAAVVPAGEHILRMSFEPKLYHDSNLISQYSFYLFVIVLLGLITLGVLRTTRKVKSESKES